MTALVQPPPGWRSLGAMILGSGMFGLTHCCLALRDGLPAAIDLEDRTWYIILPVVGYLCLAASGVTLALRPSLGCTALALSTALLLSVGIHNAWDITLWSMTRRRQ